MLKQRLITAIILIAIFLAVLFAPRPEFFGIFSLIFMAVAGWEWSRLNGIRGGGAYLLGAIVTVVCAALWYTSVIVVVMLPALWIAFGIFWVVGAAIILQGGGKRWLAIPKQVRWLLGIVILCMAWCALWSLKLWGNNLLLSILVMVWVADSGAYFGGKTFGKRKLAPSISPGKSWEGAISGAITVLLLAVIWIFLDYKFIIEPLQSVHSLHRLPIAADLSLSIFTSLYRSWGILGMIITLLFLTVMSVVGDLSESLMKRSIGMKDSSNILPGHGGVLDRIDALLPVLPLSIVIVMLLSVTSV